MSRGQKTPFTAIRAGGLTKPDSGEPVSAGVLGVAVNTMFRASDLLTLRVSTFAMMTG